MTRVKYASLGMLGLGIGYFLWYTPYGALAKAMSGGLLPPTGGPVGRWSALWMALIDVVRRRWIMVHSAVAVVLSLLSPGSALNDVDNYRLSLAAELSFGAYAVGPLALASTDHFHGNELSGP